MGDMLQVPVLFILYNRLEPAKQAFSQIRKVRPKKLYIACDGSKKDKPGDGEKVEAVRQWILSAIDWECQVNTRFAEENQGCKHGPVNAINWVFETEEEAIILEDDIVAEESFFMFCQTMLEMYRNDTKIMLVSGNKAVWDYPIEEDYFFTAYTQIWGWATWRRAWSFYDIEAKQWPYYKSIHLLADVYGKNTAICYTENIDRIYSGDLDAWDYLWTLAVAANSGLGILPKYNLIQNVGYGEDSTHTSGKAPDFHINPMAFPIKPVDHVARDWEYDRVHAKKYVNPRKFHRFARKFIPKAILRRWYRFRGVKSV